MLQHLLQQLLLQSEQHQLLLMKGRLFCVHAAALPSVYLESTDSSPSSCLSGSSSGSKLQQQQRVAYVFVASQRRWQQQLPANSSSSSSRGRDRGRRLRQQQLHFTEPHSDAQASYLLQVGPFCFLDSSGSSCNNSCISRWLYMIWQ